MLWHDKFEGSEPSSVIEIPDSGYIIGAVKDDSCGNHGSDFWLIKLGGSGIAENDLTIVKEKLGLEEQLDVPKAPGFEWILMILAIMAAFAMREKMN